MQLQDFSLTRKERKLLKLSSDSWVLESPEHERLLRLKLVEQELACNPGYIPQPTGRIKATALGVDYLKYSRAHFF